MVLLEYSSILLLVIAIVAVLIASFSNARSFRAVLFGLVLFVLAVIVTTARLYLPASSDSLFAGVMAITPAVRQGILMLLGFGFFAIALVILGQEKAKCPAEVVFLLLSILLGGVVAITATEFLLLYVGLELVALPSFILVVLSEQRKSGIEAALKYLLLGIITGLFLLYGMALLFGLCSTTNFIQLAQCIMMPDKQLLPYLLPLILLFVGLGFKVGAFPTQSWLPDVYTGASTAITSFMAIVPKVVGIYVLYQVFVVSSLITVPFIRELFLGVGMVTLFYGAVVALFQKHFRRLLAYSAIAHMGFMLLTFWFGTAALPLLNWYICSYLAATCGIFAYLLFIGNNTASDSIEEHKVLATTNPGAGMMAIILLLSMAGLPPLFGFFAKFTVMVSFYQQITDPVALASGAFLLIATVIGFAYYVPITRILFEGVADGLMQRKNMQSKLNGRQRLLLLITLLMTTMVVFLGVAPMLVPNMLLGGGL